MRTLILDAARELFVSEGIEQVSMRRIAQKIEYSPTAIYVHFRDKEALLQELCAVDFGALAGKFQVIGAIADPIERIVAAGRAYIEFGINNPSHFRLMFMTPHEHSKGDDTMAKRGNPEEDAYAFLKQAVAEGVAASRFRAGLDDPELLAQTLWAGVHGVAALEIANKRDPWVDWRPIEERVRTMTDALVRGLTRPVEA
ncbi:MAG TPA: TetR/AcrR family transcriptional regulator [Thermoanaerobaculaceae bacterium]|nr:TetR/AcrR family transcriptional regulator [Thermoanaerobaculaceae bacterium]